MIQTTTTSTEGLPNPEPSNNITTSLPISTTTISDTQNTTKPTYSQITQKQLNIPLFHYIDDSE